MLLASVLFFALANNASAANKTHVTDVLGTGNSRVDISYGIGNFTGTSNTVYANGATPTHYDANGTGSAISTAYLLGITDRLDMGITFPVSSSSSSSYTGSSSHTFKYEGQGDMTISASYLIKDKKENEVGWNLYGAISPPTAPSENSSYSSTNGTTTGKPGKGYSSNRIGTTISIPSVTSRMI